VCVCVFVCVCMYVCLCVYVCVFVCLLICLFVCVCVCILFVYLAIAQNSSASVRSGYSRSVKTVSPLFKIEIKNKIKINKNKINK